MQFASAMNRRNRSVEGKHERQQPLKSVVVLPVQQVAQTYVSADEKSAACDLPRPPAHDEWTRDWVRLERTLDIL
jgi:hypothetical protein